VFLSDLLLSTAVGPSFSVRPENEVTQQAAYQTSAKSKIWDVCVKEGSQELRS